MVCTGAVCTFHYMHADGLPVCSCLLAIGLFLRSFCQVD